jgi:hypothetical protein
MFCNAWYGSQRTNSAARLADFDLTKKAVIDTVRHRVRLPVRYHGATD